MSILFYDSDSVEKSFDKLKQAVNDIENKVNNEINNLKSQLEIKPIQRFEPLFLEYAKYQIEYWQNKLNELSEKENLYDAN
jgi:hypothetical protein